MNIEFTRSFLLWCTVINYGISCWCGFWSLRSHMTGFVASTADGFGYLDEQFDFLHYLGMSIYKIGILLFNLVPLVVLWIVFGSHG